MPSRRPPPRWRHAESMALQDVFLTAAGDHGAERCTSPQPPLPVFRSRGGTRKQGYGRASRHGFRGMFGMDFDTYMGPLEHLPGREQVLRPGAPMPTNICCTTDSSGGRDGHHRPCGRRARLRRMRREARCGRQDFGIRLSVRDDAEVCELLAGQGRYRQADEEAPIGGRATWRLYGRFSVEYLPP